MVSIHFSLSLLLTVVVASAWALSFYLSDASARDKKGRGSIVFLIVFSVLGLNPNKL
jgi:hypothetical protein